MLDSKETPLQVEHVHLEGGGEVEKVAGTDIVIHRVTTAEAEAREHGDADHVTVKTWIVVVVRPNTKLDVVP